jgi:hypothetical protein
MSDLILQSHAAPSWGERTDKFIPIGHFEDLMINKGALILLVCSAIYIWRKRNDLKPLLLHAVAALVLLNHQVFSGLQIENFHWYYASGPILYIIVLTLLIQLFQKFIPQQNIRKIATATALLFIVASGFAVRHDRCFNYSEPVRIQNQYKMYREQSGTGFIPGQVIAGDHVFLSFAAASKNLRPLSGYVATNSPNLTRGEWNERATLEGFLRGFDREGFVKHQDELLPFPGWAPWGRSQEIRQHVIEERLKIFDQIATNPIVFIRKYEVGFVAVQTQEQPPEAVLKNSVMIQSGPHWNVFRLSVQ